MRSATARRSGQAQARTDAFSTQRTSVGLAAARPNLLRSGHEALDCCREVTAPVLLVDQRPRAVTLGRLGHRRIVAAEAAILLLVLHGGLAAIVEELAV